MTEVGGGYDMFRIKEAEQSGERGAWSVAVWGRDAASIALPGLAIPWHPWGKICCIGGYRPLRQPDK